LAVQGFDDTPLMHYFFRTWGDSGLGIATIFGKLWW